MLLGNSLRQAITGDSGQYPESPCVSCNSLMLRSEERIWHLLRVIVLKRSREIAPGNGVFALIINGGYAFVGSTEMRMKWKLWIITEVFYVS